MSKANDPLSWDDPFASFFEAAEKSPVYREAKARIEFTEELIARMRELNLNRSALAERLETTPSFITRLLSGKNNFELATMTRIAHALNCDFRCHLQPKGTETMWINVLDHEPEVVPSSESWQSRKYRSIAPHSASSLNHDPLPSAA